MRAKVYPRFTWVPGIAGFIHPGEVKNKWRSAITGDTGRDGVILAWLEYWDWKLVTARNER